MIKKEIQKLREFAGCESSEQTDFWELLCDLHSKASYQASKTFLLALEKEIVRINKFISKNYTVVTKEVTNKRKYKCLQEKNNEENGK